MAINPASALLGRLPRDPQKPAQRPNRRLPRKYSAAKLPIRPRKKDRMCGLKRSLCSDGYLSWRASNSSTRTAVAPEYSYESLERKRPPISRSDVGGGIPLEFIEDNHGGVGLRSREKARRSGGGRFQYITESRIRNARLPQNDSWSQYGTVLRLFGEDHCAQ